MECTQIGTVWGITGGPPAHAIVVGPCSPVLQAATHVILSADLNWALGGDLGFEDGLYVPTRLSRFRTVWVRAYLTAFLARDAGVLPEMALDFLQGEAVRRVLRPWPAGITGVAVLMDRPDMPAVVLELSPTKAPGRGVDPRQILA